MRLDRAVGQLEPDRDSRTPRSKLSDVEPRIILLGLRERFHSIWQVGVEPRLVGLEGRREHLAIAADVRVRVEQRDQELGANSPGTENDEGRVAHLRRGLIVDAHCDSP